MAEKSIEEKVKDIIVEQLGVNPEQVTPQAKFIEDLGADSLDTVELVMAFEEEFNVEVRTRKLKSSRPSAMWSNTSKTRARNKPENPVFRKKAPCRTGCLFRFSSGPLSSY